jgi:hypothetical protein
MATAAAVKLVMAGMHRGWGRITSLTVMDML